MMAMHSLMDIMSNISFSSKSTKKGERESFGKMLELVSTKDDIKFFCNFVTSMMIFFGPIFW